MSMLAVQSIPEPVYHSHQTPKKMSQKTGSAPTSSDGSGVVKPKQSKSRNGCVTCKAKRLKCDETKPVCQQCTKRGVQCGGYKKDFKWRAFAEPVTSAPKPSKKSKASPGLAPPPSNKHHSDLSGPSSPALSDLSSLSSQPSLLPPVESYAPSDSSANYFATGYPAPYDSQPVHQQLFEPDQFGDSRSDEPYMMQSYGHHAPRLQDLLLPGSDMNRQSPIPDFMNFPFGPEELGRHRRHNEHMDISPPPHDNQSLKGEEDVEEIIRATESSDWELGTALPYPQATVENPWGMGAQTQSTSLADVFRRPSASVGNNQELWLSYFDKQTCGIMSIKDGRTENPWRTLIWPLARETSNTALYHAIASMTAFHMSYENPTLRVEGMEHMRRSIRSLASSLGNGGMPADAALATTLVLAFAESWDRHISTGIQHLRGARVLMNQALVSKGKQGLTGNAMNRLQFLYNVWVYLDVLARLTSDDDEDEEHGFESFSIGFGPVTPQTSVDPLMGCASSLFPLIGKVANLVRKIRRTPKNTIDVVEEALEVKTRIEEWVCGTTFDVIEDEHSDITHCLQTAEAYRWATLLYLHQAIPELESLSSQEIAQKVLLIIASVPVTSGTIIVHIYPLLAAGCEAETKEDRDWVMNRWKAMEHRMCIGNVDRAWEVIKEVWDRVDAAKALGVCTEEARGVRGNLHWITVMKEWGWEVLLG